MSVAITAQAPVAAASPPIDSPQVAQGTGATSEEGLVDFFAKTRADVANGNLEEATKSVASSGEMLGKLREFIDKSAQSDASNRATKAKQRAAAAEAKMELASLDTLGSLGSLGSLGNLSSLSRSSSIGQSGSFGQLASLNQFNSASLPPGPASGPFGGGLGLPGMEKGPGVAMIDKMTNDVTDGAIHRMWVQVVGHATNSVTKEVMSLLKGQ
jgi:hypothetical protein